MVPNIIGVIYATCTMGAVRIDKYKEENYYYINVNKNIISAFKMQNNYRAII